MMRSAFRPSALAMGVVLIVAGTACRQAPSTAPSSGRPSMLVNTEWLAENVGQPNMVLLHVGSRAQYDSGHVTGARLVVLADISLPAAPNTLTLQMPTVEQLSAWAVKQGISNSSRIIVIPHDDALQSATRVFITLAYLGAMDRTSLLNGSFTAWKAEGRAVTTVTPPPAAAVTFTAAPRPELIATITQVEAIAMRGASGAASGSGPSTGNGTTVPSDIAIVDARLPRFYNGDGGGYPRPGHIPSAVNIPLSTVSSNGFIKPASELQMLFTDAGVVRGKQVITYCHIGQQATLLWFVATLLGYDARMFDGSFQEWSGTARLPVVGPPAK